MTSKWWIIRLLKVITVCIYLTLVTLFQLLWKWSYESWVGMLRIKNFIPRHSKEPIFQGDKSPWLHVSRKETLVPILDGCRKSSAYILFPATMVLNRMRRKIVSNLFGNKRVLLVQYHGEELHQLKNCILRFIESII